MRDSAALLFKILVLPIVSIFLAYQYGHNGYEAFVATSLGVLILMTMQLASSSRLLFRSHHWLLTKLLIVCIGVGVWFLGFVCEMLLLTAAGHDPHVSIPHINWLIAACLALAYGSINLPSRQSMPTYTRAWINICASLYSIIILYAASLNFYADIHNSRSLVLVIAGQLQYILLYLVLRTNYIEWAVTYGQRTLSSREAFTGLSDDSGRYILLTGLPFFIPVGIILALVLS